MTDRFVYGLYQTDIAGKRSYFYVGRSSNPMRRLKQHVYGKKSRHEDVYEYLRDLEKSGEGWSYDILAKTSEADFFPDAERWQVIRLIRDGHKLKNMRHGSTMRLVELAKTDPVLAEQVISPLIRSAADVREDRERRDADTKHLRYLKSRRLRRAILRHSIIRLLKRGAVDDVAACKEMQTLIPITHRRLLVAAGGDKVRIHKEVQLADILRRARDVEQWTALGLYSARFRAELAAIPR